ncbi:MAG: phosphodiester glycosidase family protein [Hydrococcus sp. C42_A2020_068]|nr:phosphodiester glycosidase family protein [Hydrococcus sp. C42_A2020_068]
MTDSIWKSVGFFSFSLLATLVVYSFSVGSSAETEGDRPQKLDVGESLEIRSPRSQEDFKAENQDRYTAPPIRETPVQKLEAVRVSSAIPQTNTSVNAELITIEHSKFRILNSLIAQTRSSDSQASREISLNGRRFPIAWTQWNENGSVRTAITDTGAMQALGVELLSTNRSDVQPVLWFPVDPKRPISLGAKFISPYRYLDITGLVNRAGGQLQVAGNVLNIDFPQPQILNIRQGNQTWGKRLVIDLDRPVFWQVSQAPKQGAVIIEGMATPELLAQFQPSPTVDDAIQATDEDDMGSGAPSPAPSKLDEQLFSLQSDGKITKLLIDLPTAHGVQVFSLANPNRLVVDIRPDVMKQRDIVWAPGVIWRQRFVRLDRSYFPVNWLEIDPRSPGISLKPITSNPNTLEGIAPLVMTARSWQATAAINGGFFNRDSKLPLGAIRQDNRWLSSPILNRGAIAWNDKGQVKIGRLAFREMLTTSTGERLPILFLNSGYVDAGMARYTPEWGANYKTLTDNETIVVVQNNRVTQQLQAGLAGKDAFAIPTDGYLLAIRKNGAPASVLLVGTQVTLESSTFPADFASYPHVLGAGPLLIQNGRIVLNAALERFSTGFQKQMASRSAIATSDRGTLIIATVHNRVGGRGATLSELAQIMQKLGAVDALNLDGGSSTSLLLGGQSIDRSPVTAARVHNGIGIFLSTSP